MSSRHTRSMFGLLLVAVFALSAVVVAPASAKLTKHQKTHIRKQLMRSIKKNPKLIRSKHFIKKASLVDFTLPVTIRVQPKTATGSPQSNGNAGKNTASIDLGASLGSRTIGLGGNLPAEIKFHDSFDGGGLGNVDLNLLSGGVAGSGITTTSIPLLANTDVNTTAYGGLGCVGWTAANDPLGTAPGVDDPANLQNTDNDPLADHLGVGTLLGSTSPAQTVLRTGNLTLGIATPTTTTVSGGGSNNSVVIGKSGGQANLFSNIPGKSTQIDVTANLVTDINTILREVDDDNPPSNASAFDCRQAWTGSVQNFLTGIHLNGTLKISPAILADGKLRIAKATLLSPANDKARVALTACLMPEAPYAAPNAAFTGPPAGPGNSPIDPSIAPRSAPTDACNTVLDPVLSAPPASGGLGVSTLLPPGTPYSTSADGSRVTVAGDLSVNNLAAEILIGGNQF